MYGKRVVIRAVPLLAGCATSGSPQSALWLDVCLLVSYRPLAILLSGQKRERSFRAINEARERTDEDISLSRSATAAALSGA